jgi:predicted nucleotidyltransferase
MTSQLAAALTGAALSGRERRVVERLVYRLHKELGEDLRAVWLYGSRARGEADPSEADPDRRSDVDLMAIVDPARDAAALSWELGPTLEAVVDAEGDSPVYYSLRIYDADRLRDRRHIRSFFFREVDRDKLVLYGSALSEKNSEGVEGDW